MCDLLFVFEGSNAATVNPSPLRRRARNKKKKQHITSSHVCNAMWHTPTVGSMQTRDGSLMFSSRLQVTVTNSERWRMANEMPKQTLRQKLWKVENINFSGGAAVYRLTDGRVWGLSQVNPELHSCYLHLNEAFKGTVHPKHNNSVIISSDSCWWRVRCQVLQSKKTFLEVHSKTSRKQIKKKT